MATVQKISNANIYIDGTGSLLGRASGITLPEFMAVTEDATALGLMGKFRTAVGIDILQGTLKWDGYYPEVIALGADPFTARKLQIYSSVKVIGPDGLEQRKQRIISMTATFEGTPLGDYGPQANVGFEQPFSATRLRDELDGEELLEFDVFNLVWRVRGVDLLAEYRKNLGL